jgi:hypothetical protein
MNVELMEMVLEFARHRQYNYSARRPPCRQKRAAKKRAAQIVGPRPGARVLDVGGEAFYVKYFTGMQITPFNLPDDMHALASLDCYDGALAMHVLEHSPCPLYVLWLLDCALKLDAAWLYVAVPHPRPKWLAHPAHFTVLHPDGWARLIEDSGFVITHREHGAFGPKSVEERFLCERSNDPTWRPRRRELR